jgi:glyoxylase-like metal-dependent hydrolase (beta-lactamase superfamily II)
MRAIVSADVGSYSYAGTGYMDHREQSLDAMWQAFRATSFANQQLVEIDAGVVRGLLVDDDYELDDTVWLTPTPGHSPCHCCVNIRSGGQRAVVTGDLMHHALQVREPDWFTIFDWDPVQGVQSRRRFLAEIAGTGAFVLPVHFPHPTAGLVEADRDRFRFDFVR